MREPWNGVIKTALNAVDQHNAHYFQEKDARHLIAAELLRTYVKYLKDLVLSLENTTKDKITELEEDQKCSSM